MKEYDVICDGKNVGKFTDKQLKTLNDKHPDWVFVRLGDTIAIDRGTVE